MENKTLIFCPVYNEVHHLPKLIEELNNTEISGDFYFIDSGSNDGSTELIKNSKYQYLRLKKNLGVGYTIITAIEFAIQNNYKVICGISGNNKMDPKEINKLLNPIYKDNYDYVQGSRFLEESKDRNTPKFRAVSIPILSKLVSKIFEMNVTDVTCGFRAFKLELINRANFEINQKWLYGYSFEPYFYTNIFLDKKIKKIEVPVKMSYPSDKSIKYTKIKPFLNYPGLVFPYVFGKIFFKGFK